MSGIAFLITFQKVQIFVLILTIILIVSMPAAAQSGRKQSKPAQVQTQTTSESSSDSSPLETTNAESKSSRNTALSKTSLLVASNVPETMYLQFPFPEKMEEWVINRLMKSPVLNVSTPGTRLNRSEAIKRAKNETLVLTVLVELEENYLKVPEPNQRRAQTGNVWINYYILFPGSGKSKYHGRVYLNSTLMPTNRNANKIGISCYPSVRGDDLMLLQASIEIADRIMSDLSVRIPPVCTSKF